MTVTAWCRALVLAVVAVVVVTAGAARAQPAVDGDDGAAFAAASALLGQGDAAAARAGFEAVAQRWPDGRWADDALAEAATLAEQAGDLAGARALWGRIVQDHGAGRLARRAQARLGLLTEAGGTDGQFDRVAADHDRLVAAAARAEDPHPALTQLGALLDANPAYPRRHAAALWLGEAYVQQGDLAPAARWLAVARAAAATPRERFRAELELAKLPAERGDLTSARAALEALDAPDAIAQAARTEALAKIEGRLRRRWIGRAAWLALAVLALGAAAIVRRQAGSARAALAALWPPPIELGYLLPVVALLVGAAWAGNALVRDGVIRLAAGSFFVVWGAGALAGAVTPRGWRGRVAFAAGVVIATAAVAWIAVADDTLLDLLLETWRSGHDLR
ncbi:MAG: hypothetical protein R3B06_09365 [Kofleriaceae bacterium]